MAEAGGVLFVHAHPDDESMGTGGTIARLVAEGTRVDLVTCTDGAEGEIHDPTLDPEDARPRLAEIRRAELACSVEALGKGSIRHHMLGYRDSGMMGTDANAHSDCFWQADVEEATRRLVEIVKEARPAAIVSSTRTAITATPTTSTLPASLARHTRRRREPTGPSRASTRSPSTVTRGSG